MNKDTLILQISQGLSTWDIATANNTTQMNVRYWLKKYNLKTQVTLNRINKIRKCLICNKLKPQEEFYKRGIKYMSQCKPCYQQKYADIAKRNKQMAVVYLGGKCSKCNYNTNLAALEFHHKDPKLKDKGISYLMKQNIFEKLIPELDKCILLCANCHREEHNPS